MIHCQHNFVIFGFFFNKRSVIQVLVKPTFEKPTFNQLLDFPFYGFMQKMFLGRCYVWQLSVREKN